MTDTAQKSSIDSVGCVKWTKLDIDLQGQNLIDDFSILWKKLQALRTKSGGELSLTDLDELMVGVIGLEMANENLKKRVHYVLRKKMSEEILRLLGRPPETWEKGRENLAQLTDAEIKSLRDELERGVATMLEALRVMLKPDVRSALFGHPETQTGPAVGSEFPRPGE